MMPVITGSHFLGEAPNLADLYSGGYVPRWVKFVTDANYVVSRAPQLPAGVNIVWRLFEKSPFNSNEFSAWIGGDTAANSARRLITHLDSDLRILQQITGRLVAVDGFFNEVGHEPRYAEFCFECARILWDEYGLLLAAFGSSTGSYNDAQALMVEVQAQGVTDFTIESAFAQIIAQNAASMADGYVKPCIAAGIPVYLSLHAYASLYPMVWHGPNRQKADIARIWQSGITGDIFGLNDLMPASVLDDESGPPATYTGFGWIRLLWHFKHQHNIDLKKVVLLMTEGGLIDNVGDPGIGATAGGWHHWTQYWNRLRLPGEDDNMTAARGLLYIERQCRIFAPLLADIASMPFTHTDSNKQSRWHLEFEVASIMPQFKQLLATLGDTSQGCRATPRDGRVNIRQAPSVIAPVVGSLEAGTFITPLAITHDDNGEAWYRTASGYIASWVVTLSGTCDLPIEDDNGAPNMNKFTPVYFDPDGATLTEGHARFAPPLLFSVGDPNQSGDAYALMQQKGVQWFWFQYNPSAGDEPPDYGDMSRFMDAMRGQPTNAMVNSWFNAVSIDQYVNSVRKQTFADNQPTGSNPVIDNPYYNPFVYISVLDGDGVPGDQLGAFLGFSAEVARQLWEGRTVNSWPLQYGLHSALLNMNIDRFGVQAFWDQAIGRGLLTQAVNTDGVLVLHKKINGRFQDKTLRDAFPIETFEYLAAKGWFSQLKFFLKFEYVGGWKSQEHTEQDVLADLWLIEKTARQYPEIEGWSFMLHNNEAASSDQWKKDHDIASIEASFAAILDGSAAPNVDWQPEDDDPPTDPGPGPLPEPSAGCWGIVSRLFASLTGNQLA